MRTSGDSPCMRVIGMLGGMSWESSAQYYRPLTFNGLCAQGLADRPYNGGWTVALEPCRALSGQYWKVEAGPITHGRQSDYIGNEYNPAYCLAWDQNAGTLFANTCRNAWYQQIIIKVPPNA
jgi:hypothetical protein